MAIGGESDLREVLHLPEYLLCRRTESQNFLTPRRDSALPHRLHPVAPHTPAERRPPPTHRQNSDQMPCAVHDLRQRLAHRLTRADRPHRPISILLHPCLGVYTTAQSRVRSVRRHQKIERPILAPV